MATISSRTPEGSPNHCPICGAEVVIEPSLFFGDAPCPACGTLLWFCASSSGDRLFFDHASSLPLRERLKALVREHLGVVPDAIAEKIDWEKLGADSLDMVELVMELEEEGGLDS